MVGLQLSPDPQVLLMLLVAVAVLYLQVLIRELFLEVLVVQQVQELYMPVVLVVLEMTEEAVDIQEQVVVPVVLVVPEHLLLMLALEVMLRVEGEPILAVMVHIIQVVKLLLILMDLRVRFQVEAVQETWTILVVKWVEMVVMVLYLFIIILVAELQQPKLLVYHLVQLSH